MNYFRQGDICIVPIGRLRTLSSEQTRRLQNIKPIKRDQCRVVLQYGEATGHAHAILEEDVELFEPGEASQLAERYLRVGPGGAVLVHEEHGPIPLEEGWYEVRRQREYEPAAIRLVAD